MSDVTKVIRVMRTLRSLAELQLLIDSLWQNSTQVELFRQNMTNDGSPLPEFIGAKPDDLETLIGAMIEADDKEIVC